MSVSNKDSVVNQVQKFWSPLFMQELRASSLLPGLVNKDYEGQIKSGGGDTVYVSQINAPQGQNLDVGTNADSFNSEEISLSRVAVVANKRAVASYEFADLALVQSQLEAEMNGGPASEIRMALMYAVEQKINAYLYSLVSPSTATPDHLIGSVADFNKTQLIAMRKLAGAAKWGKNKPWYALLDPSYYGDALADTTLTSGDYAPGEAPVIGGQIAKPRYGFGLLEDNSLAVDQGILFHPDFLHLVMQTEVQFKISDQHANKKFGYVMSADIVYGAAQGIDGDKKHILVNAGSDTSVSMA